MTTAEQRREEYRKRIPGLFDLGLDMEANDQGLGFLAEILAVELTETNRLLISIANNLERLANPPRVDP